MYVHKTNEDYNLSPPLIAFRIAHLVYRFELEIGNLRAAVSTPSTLVRRY